MRNRYNLVQIYLHWITLLLLVLTYSAMLSRSLFSEDSEPLLQQIHFNLGITVWTLMLVRWLLRHKYPSPPITPPLPLWQQRLATLTHWGIYLWLLVLPLFGFFSLQFGARELLLFLDWQVPFLVAKDAALRASLRTIHETLASVGYFLITLHTLAALYHHYIRRDDTLLRMKPGK